MKIKKFCSVLLTAVILSSCISMNGFAVGNNSIYHENNHKITSAEELLNTNNPRELYEEVGAEPDSSINSIVSENTQIKLYGDDTETSKTSENATTTTPPKSSNETTATTTTSLPYVEYTDMENMVDYHVYKDHAEVEGLADPTVEDLVIVSKVPYDDNHEVPVTIVPEMTFWRSFSIKTIVIPDSITTIDTLAFVGLFNVKSVVIPDSVTYIGNGAFFICEELEDVKVSANVKYVGSRAFEGTKWLDKVRAVDPIVIFNGQLYDACKTEGDVVLPNTVRSIGNSAFIDDKKVTSIKIPESVVEFETCAFQGCSNLKKVNIPKSVKIIDGNSFYECKSLEGVDVDKDNPNFCSVNGALYTKDMKKIMYCPQAGIEKFEVPEGVEILGVASFFTCGNLTSVKLPNTVKTIENAAFGYCSELRSINIPNSVTLLSTRVFMFCNSLKSITIPNSIKVIDQFLLYDCANLLRVYIPESITSFYSSALSGCDELTDIYYGGSEEQWKALNVKGLGFRDEDGVFIDLDPTMHYNYKTPVTTKTTTNEATTSVFKNITKIYGILINLTGSDPNKDNSIDAKDATMILVDYASRISGLNGRVPLNIDDADSNNDGNIDAKDATNILIYSAHQISG